MLLEPRLPGEEPGPHSLNVAQITHALERHDRDSMRRTRAMTKTYKENA